MLLFEANMRYESREVDVLSGAQVSVAHSHCISILSPPNLLLNTTHPAQSRLPRRQPPPHGPMSRGPLHTGRQRRQRRLRNRVPRHRGAQRSTVPLRGGGRAGRVVSQGTKVPEARIVVLFAGLG